MKKYIILGTFFDMGGGQIYTRNKVDYLKKNGWIVDVYTGRVGALLLQEMYEYKDNYIPELNYFPFYICKKHRNEIIKSIGRDRAYDEIVVETHNFPLAIWGELLASLLGAKHVFFNLCEEFPRYEKWEYEYLDFKHKRKELAGIIEDSLTRLFDGYKTVPASERYHLNFICQNSISEDENPILKCAIKADINLGCVSRLDKGYILPMVNEICKFAVEHSNKIISLTLVGDTPERSIIEHIKYSIGKTENVTLYLLGYLSPLPKNLFTFVDYFVGTSGSAIMTSQAGKITIYVDTSNCTPIGIAGYNTSSLLFANDENKSGTLHEYLEQVIFKENTQKIRDSLISNNKYKFNDYMDEFNKHMKFIYSSNLHKEYFTFNNLSIINKAKMNIIKILGIKGAKRIKNLRAKKNDLCTNNYSNM